MQCTSAFVLIGLVMILTGFRLSSCQKFYQTTECCRRGKGLDCCYYFLKPLNTSLSVDCMNGLHKLFSDVSVVLL